MILWVSTASSWSWPWEESFGVDIANAEAASIRTPRMATDVIYRKLSASVVGPGGCLTQRAFHRVRSALQSAWGVRRVAIRPDSPLAELLPAGKRHRHWQTLSTQVGTTTFPRLFFGRLPQGCHTVGGLARCLVTRQPRHFRGPAEPWTRSHVRSLVRDIIAEQLGISEFSDDDDFVRDLRVD